MARAPTGSTKWNPTKKVWQVRVSVPIPGGGERRQLYDMAEIGETDVERARHMGAVVSRRVRAGGAVPIGTGETVNEWSDRWLADRDERGLTTVADDRTRLRKYILPVIGTLEMRNVTRGHIQDLVASLDRRVRDPLARFEWKTALHVWGNVTKMFKDACRSKRRDLQVLDQNPARDVEGPDRGSNKSKQYLWPKVFSAFVADENIPLAWRRLLAISVYTYARPEEIEPLEWSDVNLEVGVISIHRAIDRVRKKGTIRTTKTGKTRRPPIEKELLPLLQAMHAEQKGKGRVILAMPPAYELSRQMRKYLARALVTANVDPADLFTNDATRKQIDWYGATRGTGITWCAVRGDQPLTIMQRAGHALFSTTMGYIREAENLSIGFGRPFPALPKSLLGQSAFQSVNRLRKVPQTPVKQWAQQGLNL